MGGAGFAYAPFGAAEFGAAELEQAVSTAAAAAMASGRRRRGMPFRRIVTSLRWLRPAREADREPP